MTYAVTAQVSVACLILLQSIMMFIQSDDAGEEKAELFPWKIFGKAKEASPGEEYARLSRKAQSFWQGGLSHRHFSAGHRR